MNRLFKGLLFISALILAFTHTAFSQETQATTSAEEEKLGRFYIILDHPPKTIEEKFPIAVPDLLYLDKTSDRDNFAVKITDVIRNDLNLAGYFNVLDKTGFHENPGTGLTTEEIDFSKWKSTGARALVKGGMRLDGKNIVIQIRLFDPITSEMLVGKEYRVDKKSYRAAAHRFMDEIMLALTGEKGVFSTRIVAACGKIGQREIVIMDVDGENITPITKNKSVNVSPVWSPDGTQIAYTSYEKYFPEIFIASTDGKGKPKRVTYNNSMNITPTFAPDGSGLAVSSSMSGDPEIYLIDAQGNKLEEMTHSFGIDLSPTWSPDSQNLIFSSERGGNLQLYSMDRHGANVKRITFVGSQNDQADWSPKGDKVVYSSREHGIFDIYSINVDGSMQQRLTTGPGSSEAPSFSPDARYVVYSNTRNHKTDLYLMLWEGSNQTQISHSGDCVNPDWSPWLQ